MKTIDKELLLLRNEIERCDKKLIDILITRFTIVQDIAKIKNAYNEKIVQPKRVEYIKQYIKEYISDKKIDINFVNEIFNIIHKKSVSIQEEYLVQQIKE